jgi:hypothetical protein
MGFGPCLTTFQEESMGTVNNSRLDRIQAEFHCVACGGGDKEDNLNNYEVEGEKMQGAQRQPACTFFYHGHFTRLSIPKGDTS